MKIVLLICGLGLLSTSFASSNKVDRTLSEVNNIFASTKIMVRDVGTSFKQEDWPTIMVNSTDGTAGWEGPYLNSIPKDPWGNGYVLSIENDNLVGVYSFGVNEVDDKGDNDDISSWKMYNENIYFPTRKKNRLLVFVSTLLLVFIIVSGVHRISRRICNNEA